MSKTLKKFIRLSIKRKILFFITGLLSLYTWFLFWFFKEKARFKRNNNPSAEFSNDLLVQDIRWAISTVSKYAPWENVCRHQAYQAMLLCRYYQIPYKIFVGFRKNPNTREIEGHAWTIVNSDFITGLCKPEEYIVQAVY